MILSDEQKKYIKNSFSNLHNVNDLVGLFGYVAPLVSPQSKYKNQIRKKFITYCAFHAENPYEKFRILKKNGSSVREIATPFFYLKLLQKCVNCIFNVVFEPHYSAYGFVPTKNIVQNANQHINRNFVLNVDLTNFFGSISFRRVKTVLELPPFNLNDELAFLIANLCCYEGFLPQGAPTSPILSNIVCQKLDRRLTHLAKEHHAKYTRYADDITFSSKRVVFDEIFSQKLREIIESENFKINHEKTRLQNYAQRQIVTGLTVNEKVNVSQKYIRELRAMLHNWEKHGYKKAQKIFEKNYSQYNQAPDFKACISGKLLFLGLVRSKSDLLYLKYKTQFANLTQTQTLKSQIDITKIKVINIPAFFELFHTSKGVKYLTHDYDIGKFDYDVLLKVVKEELEEKIKKYPIPEYLFSKILNFTFEKRPYWSYENIKLGWSAEKFVKWCKNDADNHKHPSQNEYWRTEMLAKFKNSIEIRKPKLRDLIENLIEEKLDKEKNFRINLIDLEKAAFYTDVDQVRNGLRYIFAAINDYSLDQNIEVSFIRERIQNSHLYKKTIKIIDKNSIMDINADKNEFKGDLRSAQKNLRGLCEWIIEAQFNNGYFRLYLLHDEITENSVETISPEQINGLTHFLHFYS